MIPESLAVHTNTYMLEDQPFLIDSTFLSQCNRMTRTCLPLTPDYTCRWGPMLSLFHFLFKHIFTNSTGLAGPVAAWLIPQMWCLLHNCVRSKWMRTETKKFRYYAMEWINEHSRYTASTGKTNCSENSMNFPITGLQRACVKSPKS